jgi:hypothetical protein
MKQRDALEGMEGEWPSDRQAAGRLRMAMIFEAVYSVPGSERCNIILPYIRRRTGE